jgi:exosortase
VGLNPAVQLAEIATPLKFTGPRRPSWWQLFVLGAALVWLYYSILWHLVAQWIKDPNFTHGFFVPAFSLFVVWERRQQLAALPRQPAWSGLWILAFGLTVLAAGVLGAELFLSRVSLLLILTGLIALFLGWNYVRALAFPLAFLLLMIPIPRIIFNSITGPLQTWAAISAAHILPLLGVPVLREGNIIRLPSMALDVAEACSGIRSLMSLTTLAIMYGYLMDSRTWVRVTLALASIPIAIVANSLRIVGTGLVVQYWSPDMAEGFFHSFSGWLLFVVALSMLFLLHRFLNLVTKEKGAR